MSIRLHNPIETTSRPLLARLNFTRWTPRTSSLVAGVTLALMAVLAGWANFGAINPLITPGDAEATAGDIAESGPVFLAAIASLYLVAVLDVVAAAALYPLFRPVSRRLSALTAGLRVAYALIFAVAISALVSAYTLVGTPSEALRATDAFTTIWVIGLGVFGVHLLLLGYLAFRSRFVARIFGVLLAVAGAGYLADAIGTVLVAGFSAVFAQVLFAGEVALIFWLLIRGVRLPAR